MVQDKKKKNKKNKNKNKNQANETPPEVVPQAAEVPAEPIANGLTTNANQTIQNDESSVMKSLTAEASQWTTYNWAAIQDAEAKYQTYLATKRKVHLKSRFCFGHKIELLFFRHPLPRLLQKPMRKNLIFSHQMKNLPLSLQKHPKRLARLKNKLRYTCRSSSVPSPF